MNPEGGCIVKLKNILSLLICCSVCFALSACNNQAAVKKENAAEIIDTSSFSDAPDGVVLENDNFSCSMDSKAHFVIENKKSGDKYYSSVFSNIKGEVCELQNEAKSELTINYYDADSKEQTMTSSANSVEFESYVIKAKDNRVCVEYTFSLESTKSFVPSVLTEDMYKKLTDKADNADKFKIKLLYKYYKPDDTTAEAGEIHSQYEYSKQNPVYILKNNVSDSDKQIFVRVAKASNYGQAEYNEDLRKNNITLSEDDSVLSFFVPVVYTLENDGFTAQIDSSRISSTSTANTLQSVNLLPYFNTNEITDKNGFIFVPDGSGAMIEIDKADNSGYSQKIYGIDYAVKNDRTSVVSKNAIMPVWGMSSQNGSFFANITGAAEIATIKANRAGNTNYCFRSFASFDIKAKDSYVMRKSTIELAVFFFFFLSENPTVHYSLLEKNSSVFDMASVYKNYLNSNNMLNDSKFGSGLYLDYTGYVTVEASFMGVPYQKKIILSTVKDIISNIKALQDENIGNIYVRLSGIGNGGLYHYLNDKFTIDKEIGTVDELNELSKLLKSSGGALIIETDFSEVYKTKVFDGFTLTHETLKTLDKNLCNISERDIVSGEENRKLNVRYLVSPNRYFAFAENYLKSFDEAKLDSDIILSFANAGEMLLSDFNRNEELSRIGTVDEIQKVAESYKNKSGFATDNGNAYIYKYSDILFDVPVSDSGFNLEKTSVPFVAMVLHGKIPYSSDSLNTSYNSDKLLLKSLISGAHFHYSLVTDESALAKITASQSLLPTAFSSVFEAIIEQNEKYGKFYNSISKEQITDYKVVSDGVSCVEYGNGVSVIVNESEKDYMYNGTLISSESCVFKGVTQ